MAAGDTIFACRGVSHGGALSGITHARLVPSTIFQVDPGASGAKGPADALVTYYGLAVELYGKDLMVLLGRIGQEAADCVIQTHGAAGAAEELTISKVMFHEVIDGLDIARVDEDGDAAAAGIRGGVLFGEGEVFADVIKAG